MGKDLTNSSIERQNVLNNPYAVQEIQKAVDIQCIPFEDRIWLTKEQIASFFEVTPRTIDNYISKYEKELCHNGYEVIYGKRLNKFRIAVWNQYVNETDFVNIKVPKLGIFDFRAFLNSIRTRFMSVYSGKRPGSTEKLKDRLRSSAFQRSERQF